MVQKAPTKRLGGQSLDWVKRLTPVPARATLEILRAEVPVLERATLWVGLEAPAVMLEKSMEGALRLAVGAAPVMLIWAQVALANAVPVEVVPLSETKYVPVASEPGITNWTRSLLPMILVTELTWAGLPGPAHVGATLSVTLAAGMVPEGNPEPVTFTAVIPLAPELGAVHALSFTDCAVLDCGSTSRKAQARPRTTPMLFGPMMGPVRV